ncbi:MAG: DinB family protein [Saprospiraceae bacterium]
MKSFRNNGAVGALLDEYEKALTELYQVILPIHDDELTMIVDADTKDPDCKSIQTILAHVVRSGYAYVIYVRNHLGEKIEFKERKYFDTVQPYIEALKKMFEYNIRLFEDYPNLELETHDPDLKIKTNWGQYYDVEQIFEHAIVHILRHRRQIERFLLKIKNPN